MRCSHSRFALVLVLVLGSSTSACTSSLAPSDDDVAALGEDLPQCEAMPLAGLNTRIFASAKNPSVFYALKEQWHVTAANTHDLFLHENAIADSTKASAATSPFFRQMFLAYRVAWSTHETTEAIVAALREATGLPSVELRELTSASPPSIRATLNVEPADLLSRADRFEGKDLITTVLVRNGIAFNGNETNQFVQSFEKKKGIVGLGRSFHVRCAAPGGSPSVRPLAFRDGVAPEFGATNEIQYDTAGLKIFNDVDFPLALIRALDDIVDVDRALSQPAGGRAEWAKVHAAYVAAGFGSWRDNARAELTAAMSWGEPWGRGSVRTSSVQAKAQLLRDQLVAIVQAGANAVGSAEAPAAFLHRETASAGDVMIAGVLLELDRIVAFREASVTRPFK